MPLTPRQAEILAFIREYCATHDYSPTLAEIGQHFNLTSVATVHKHVMNLVEKGYLQRSRKNCSRDMEVVSGGEPGSGVRRIPLVGTVAEGQPVIPLYGREEVLAPEPWLGPARTFALRVEDDSLLGEQIRAGDLLVIEERKAARNGETVLALIDGDRATIKRYEHTEKVVRLVSADPDRPALEQPIAHVQLQGAVVGVLRLF